MTIFGAGVLGFATIKDDIANIAKSELAQVMEGFGYGVLKAFVTDIDPDAKVKEAMNEINAAQRMRVVATEGGEADRILEVKAAEGDAQSKALQGRGIADQRQAIVVGLRDSVYEFRKSMQGEHLIRYTREYVLPRLERALAEIQTETGGTVRIAAAVQAKTRPLSTFSRAVAR